MPHLDTVSSYRFVAGPKVSPLEQNAFVTVTIIKSTRVLTHVPDGSGMIELPLPVGIHLVQKEDGVTAENQELSIFAGGCTESEALEDFQSTLLASWHGLRDASEYDLTPDALALRTKLSQHFLGA